MKLKGELIIEINGKEIYRGESKSLLQNFARHLRAMIASGATTPSSATITNLVGGSATVYGAFDSDSYRTLVSAYNAPDNDDTYGIVVGSGDTPVSPTDFNLASKIPHGTSSGQLDYDTHTTTSSFSSTSSYVEISRIFTNKSGGDVIVKEVGMITWNYRMDRYNAVTTDVKFLVARDVLPSPILIPNLASLTVRYRISLSL